MLIYNLIPDYNAGGQYRAVMPSQFLPALLPEDYTFTTSTDLSEADLDRYDWFIFHRCLKPSFIPVVSTMKAKGKKIIINIDDDVLSVPDWNPAHVWAREQANISTYLWGLKTADAVIATTEQLRTALITQDIDPSKIHIAPNLINLNYRCPTARNYGRKLTILWAGSIHHERDLLEVVPAVERLHKDYADFVQVYFWGDIPEPLCDYSRILGSNLARPIPARRFFPFLGFMDGCSFEEYVERLFNIVQPDIALAPLCECAFNHSKSNIKWLEMTLAGAAVVATDLPPYQCIQYEHTGLLVKPGDVDGWYTAITRLIQDRRLRTTLQKNALVEVERDWSWQSCAFKWVDALREICDA